MKPAEDWPAGDAMGDDKDYFSTGLAACVASGATLGLQPPNNTALEK